MQHIDKKPLSLSFSLYKLSSMCSFDIFNKNNISLTTNNFLYSSFTIFIYLLGKNLFSYQPKELSSNNFLFSFCFKNQWSLKNFSNYYIVFNSKKNQFISIYILQNFIEHNSSKLLLLSFFNNFFKNFQFFLNSLSYGWFLNLNFIGIGYKVFLYNNFLFLRLGFSRMIRVEIPTDILVLTRKRNNLKLVSSNFFKLSAFAKLLKSLRGFDQYKGKGIFSLSDFSVVKLKVGKKQQFF